MIVKFSSIAFIFLLVINTAYALGTRPLLDSIIPNNQIEKTLFFGNPTDSKATKSIPSNDCSLEYDHVDEFTGKRSYGVVSENIFNFTPKNYRKFLETTHFISASAALSGNDEKQYLLRLNIVINSRNALKQFGNISPNSTLDIFPIGQSALQLTSYKGAQAKIKGDAIYYEVQYAIPSKTAKKLINMELDKIRIAWDKGFQSYEIFDIDILARQYQCIQKLLTN